MSLPQSRPYADIRPDTVLCGKTPAELRQDVYLLTRLLSGCKTNVAKSTKGGLHLERFRDIARVLTVGRGAGATTAVTGHLEADRIVLVVCNNETRSPSDSSTLRKVARSRSRRTAHELLTHWSEEDTTPASVDFETHLRDVVSILQYLLRRRSASERLSRSRDFTLFTIRRTYAQIGAQVALAFNVWGDHPTSFLRHILASRKWKRGHPKRAVISLHAFGDAPSPSFVVARLARHGIRPCKKGGSSFLVTPDNVCAWATALDEVYKPLREIVEGPPAGGIRVRVKNTPSQKDVFIRIYEAMMALRILLDSTLLEAIHAYVPAGADSESFQRVRQEQWKARFNGVNDEGRDLDAEAVFPQEIYEDGADHMARYLKSVIDIPRAICSILSVQTPTRCKTVDAYQLTAPAGYGVDQEAMRCFAERYLAELTGACTTAGPSAACFVDSAQAFLSRHLLDDEEAADLVAIQDDNSVHPEAALMSMVHSFHSGDSEGESNDVAREEGLFVYAKEVPIGVNRASCTCCTLLARHLSTWPGRKLRVTYALPGTHSTVAPWSAPKYGVPPLLLEGIRRELFSALHVVACKHDSGLLSTRYRAITDEPRGPPPAQLWESDSDDDDEDAGYSAAALLKLRRAATVSSYADSD